MNVYQYRIYYVDRKEFGYLVTDQFHYPNNIIYMDGEKIKIIQNLYTQEDFEEFMLKNA